MYFGKFLAIYEVMKIKNEIIDYFKIDKQWIDKSTRTSVGIHKYCNNQKVRNCQA